MSYVTCEPTEELQKHLREQNLKSNPTAQIDLETNMLFI